jgi:hypothetical protein
MIARGLRLMRTVGCHLIGCQKELAMTGLIETSRLDVSLDPIGS